MGCLFDCFRAAGGEPRGGRARAQLVSSSAIPAACPKVLSPSPRRTRVSIPGCPRISYPGLQIPAVVNSVPSFVSTRLPTGRPRRRPGTRSPPCSCAKVCKNSLPKPIHPRELILTLSCTPAPFASAPSVKTRDRRPRAPARTRTPIAGRRIGSSCGTRYAHRFRESGPIQICSRANLFRAVPCHLSSVLSH
jgi:hypothetical protein